MFKLCFIFLIIYLPIYSSTASFIRFSKVLIMTETKLTGLTPDIAEENINALKNLFPEVFTEGKIDFDALKQVLGEYVDDEKERYNFTWNGKGKALRLAQTPSSATLRPCIEESKNWDATENLYIEGDNLEVLKLLQKSYYSKVKMIYIDPPYNTGNDFVYSDDFLDTIGNYKAITGQVDDSGRSNSSNSETSGRFHTDWLNMMYPRLKLARNLLSDDGIIFMSIDDNEISNLKKICDEIFGEENFVSIIVVESGDTYGAKVSHKDKTVLKVKDYVLLYSKNSSENVTRKPLYDKSKDLYDSHFSYVIDNHLVKTDFIAYLKNNSEVVKEFSKYGLEIKKENISTLMLISQKFNDYMNYEIAEFLYKDQQFTLSLPSSIEDELDSGSIIKYDKYLLTRTTGGTIRHYRSFKETLQYTDENISTYCKSSIRGDLWKNFVKDMGNVSKEGDVEFKNGKKPVRLIKQLLKWGNNKDCIVLDFFSGSATAAHSVFQLNAEDGGNRKFIMVQLPVGEEKTNQYKNICEIGKERIRRAGEKIKAETGKEDLDIGFKVFKLDSSNIQKWQPDADNIKISLSDFIDNYVEGRTEQDVVYEILLKMGLELTVPVEEYEFSGKKVYSAGFGALMICTDDDITADVSKGMIELHQKLRPEVWKVVFKDNGFATDSVKTNVRENLKTAGLAEDNFTTI
jgi:Adenine specific DNA methylase Mod